MSATWLNILKWELSRDDEGHRTYDVTSKVLTSDVADGPLSVLSASGLPAVGSYWAIGNDEDLYAYCTPYAQVSCAGQENEINTLWHVKQKFTTQAMRRCNSAGIDDPLAEPAKLSGGFRSYSEEAITDRHGDLLLMSSGELMRGDVLLVERGRPTVRVSINVSSLPLSTFAQYRGGVNDDTLWGLPARTIRLADITWERNVYGTCNYYYTITYEFEVKYETWNRFIPDKGQYAKVIKDAPLSATNRLVPIQDPLTGRVYTAYLDGSGGMVGWVNAPDALDPGDIYIWEKELEPEFNFLTLGVPSSL